MGEENLDVVKVIPQGCMAGTTDGESRLGYLLVRPVDMISMVTREGKVVVKCEYNVDGICSLLEAGGKGYRVDYKCKKL